LLIGEFLVLREARGKALSDEAAQQIVNELKPKHPVCAEIIHVPNSMLLTLALELSLIRLLQ
jgi:hypothetical protein